jgi:hypothetical protein
MKKLLIIALLIVGCKKKDIPPEPEPEPTPIVTPIDTCKTGMVKFAGKFVRNGDTVIVKFIKNNCPVTNSNTYETTGMVKAVAEFTTGPILNLSKITTTSAETADKMQDDRKVFTFFNKQDTGLIFICNNLTNKFIVFRRVK